VVWAHALLQAQVGKTAVRLNLWNRLGGIGDAANPLERRWVRELQLPVFTAVKDLYADVHAGTAAAVDVESKPKLNLETLSEFVGVDTCDHPDGRWRLGGGSYEFGDRARSDTALLTCPSCRREQVALEPRHRLPDVPVVALDPEDHDWYLRREQVYALLTGKLLPLSYEELLQRDGRGVSDPSAYAVIDGVTTRPEGSYEGPPSDEKLVARRRRKFGLD
jgi:hypothetical protein